MAYNNNQVRTSQRIAALPVNLRNIITRFSYNVRRQSMLDIAQVAREIGTRRMETALKWTISTYLATRRKTTKEFPFMHNAKIRVEVHPLLVELSVVTCSPRCSTILETNLMCTPRLMTRGEHAGKSKWFIRPTRKGNSLGFALRNMPKKFPTQRKILQTLALGSLRQALASYNKNPKVSPIHEIEINNEALINV